MRALSFATVFAGLALLAPLAARAAAADYTMQPLAQIGGMAGDVPISKSLIWLLGPLNDNGQLVVDASSWDGSKSETLLQYSGGKFTPLVAAGMNGPVGPWPKGIVITGASMNQSGDVVFEAAHAPAYFVGIFTWNARSGQMTPVALKGMPATGNLTYTDGNTELPQINNRDEIALTAVVKGPKIPPFFGLLFRTPDAALQPILVPGQSLPDGKKVIDGALLPSINDAGVVAFLAQRSGDSQYSSYEWEKGNLTPLVTVGMDAPGGGKIAAVSSVLLNNQNASALVCARVTGTPGAGLYRAAGGTLTPVAVAGQAMPGGGNFKSIPVFAGTDESTLSISNATEAGQNAFVATLQDGSTGVYRVDPDGTLALVVKTGMVTPLGRITRFGPYSPPAMNSQGQVVVSASFDGGPDTLLQLTPSAP